MRFALLLILSVLGTAGYGRWAPTGRPVSVPWRAVRALPNGLCWVAGDSGTVYASSDFGQTWTLQLAPTSARLLSVDFSSPNNGWIVGEGGAAAHTFDGGGSWSAVTITHDELGIGPPDAIAPVSAADDTHSWALARWGDTSLLYHSSDSGVTWLKANYSDHGYYSPGTVYGMAFSSDTAGWLVASRFDGVNYLPVLLRTTNGGAAWTAFDAPPTLVNSGSDPAWIVSVQAYSPTVAWLHVWDTVHLTGVLFQLSQNVGNGLWTWKSWLWNNRISRIAFNSPTAGILVGDATWQTKDGLVSNSQSANPGAAYLVADFSSAFRGFAGAPDGSLYKWAPDNAGDADLSGRVDLVDAAIVAKLAAGRTIPASVSADLADADGDGQITIADAAIVLRRASGLSL